MEKPFYTRGVGMGQGPECFVCGKEEDIYSNISGFVKSKEDGEIIVSWFERGARLDYRDLEPDWIQVKIVACSEHIDNLHKLNNLCKDKCIKPIYICMATMRKGK